MDKEILLTLPRSPLGKALDYAKKHVPSLKTVLLDGRLEIVERISYLQILLKVQLLVAIYIVL